MAKTIFNRRMEFLHPAMCTIMTLISPGDCTLQCGMWLWDHGSEFTKWPTLQSDMRLWHDMSLNTPKRPPYWNSTSGFDFDHITAVDMSLCTSLQNFVQIGPPSAEWMMSCRFSRWQISSSLDFSGPIMGSLKSPCTSSYRTSIETIALNCLVSEKIAFLHFGNRQTNRQTERRTDGQDRCMKPLSLSRAAA